MKTSIIPNFKGKRWLKISCRAVHLVGFAGVFASVITGSAQPIYWWLVITSGIALFMLEALSNFVWFFQVRGLAIYIKMSLLIAAFYSPQNAWLYMVLMILLSGLIAHAPSSVRYFSFLHFKKITSINDIKG